MCGRRRPWRHCVRRPAIRTPVSSPTRHRASSRRCRTGTSPSTRPSTAPSATRISKSPGVGVPSGPRHCRQPCSTSKRARRSCDRSSRRRKSSLAGRRSCTRSKPSWPRASISTNKMTASSAAHGINGRIVNQRHQYRLALCGHKAVEAGAVCLVLMVQGHLADVTLAHFAIAAKTGLLAVSPVLLVTFSQYVRHFLNRWTTAVFLGGCTFAADALIHSSHYPGAYTEAALTGAGAFVFSVVVSYTPLGARIDRLAESFLERNQPTAPASAGG